MTSTLFKDLYDGAESGGGGPSIPAGVYDVVVTGVRPRAESSLVFLSLSVLSGPSKGQEIDVNLFFPGESSKRGARIFFARKIAGFLSYPDVKAAFMAADGAPDFASGLDLIATALSGKQITADIGLRTEGEYAGSNELRSTSPMGGSTPTGVATQAVTAQTDQPNTAPVQAPPGGVPF